MNAALEKYSLRVVTTTPVNGINTEPEKKKKLYLIQIFRGLAAIIVVLHHIAASDRFYFNFSAFNGVFAAGWNGVDFFFVLSGFIITYVHLNDIGKKETIYAYAYKRFVRIYPTFWVFASISLLYFLLFDGVRLQDHVYIIKSMLLIPQKDLPVLGVSWSLCFEVCFYLLFGMYILGGYGCFIAGLCIHLAGIILCQLQPGWFSGWPALSFLFNNLALEFIIGSITAVIFLKAADVKMAKYKYLLLSSGIALFLITWYLTLTNGSYSRSSINSRVFYGLSSGMLIFGAGYVGQVRQSVVSRLLLKIGDASYVLYLAHGLILALGFKGYAAIIREGYLPADKVTLYGFSFIMLILCIAISLLYFVIIEKPMIGALNNIFRKQKQYK